MTRIAIIGLGATGAHVARQLSTVDDLVLVDTDSARATTVASSIPGSRVGLADVDLGTVRPDRSMTRDLLDGLDVVVLAVPTGVHAGWAQASLEAGVGVVSIGDDLDDIRALLDLDPLARSSGRPLVVGAGFSPGLTCLLARHASELLDEVVDIAVAKSGTGGPACARQHHRAMKLDAHDWIDGSWVARRGGSGRDLAWFPPPIGARDCYKASLPSPLLLQRQFPAADQIVARVSATRRDRLTKRLPMLRPPHDDGGPGAVRVEVRGRVDGAFESIIYAAMDHPSVAAGATGAVVARAVSRNEIQPGARGLAEVDDTVTMLSALRDRGVRFSTFEGSAWNG